LEKVVYNQLIQYVNKNNILTEMQSGFRSNYSCETAVLEGERLVNSGGVFVLLGRHGIG